MKPQRFEEALPRDPAWPYSILNRRKYGEWTEQGSDGLGLISSNLTESGQQRIDKRLNRKRGKMGQRPFVLCSWQRLAIATMMAVKIERYEKENKTKKENFRWGAFDEHVE